MQPLFLILRKQGYSVDQLRAKKSYHVYSSEFYVPDLGLVNCTVVRFSKIKVRKYGSGYQVDIHEQRAERWKEVDVSSYISKLWKPLSLDINASVEVILLIGFDKAQNPLGRELLELQTSLRWETKEVVYLTRVWNDKAKRGFGVRLAAWASFVSISAIA